MKLIKNYLYSHLDLIVFSMLLMVYDLMLRFFCGLTLGKLPIIVNFLILFLIYGALSLIPMVIRKPLELVSLLLAGIYVFAQTLHYEFFMSFFSFNKATVMGELKGVMSEVFTKLSVSHLLFLIPFILFALFIVFYKYKDTNDLKMYVLRVLVLVLAISMGYFGKDLLHKRLVNREIENEEGWLSDAYIYDSIYSNDKFVDRFGVYDYIYKDIRRVIDQKSMIEYSEEDLANLEEFVDRYSVTSSNEYSGMFKDKNLILILCESLNNYPLDKEELCPTLYKLANEGYYFTRYYAPIYQSATGDSEFISETSMMPSIDYGTTSYTFQNNAYPYALASLFKQENYQANSYHSYIAQFYNRELFHAQLGFTTFYDMDRLGLVRPEGYIDGTNWIYDEDLLLATLEHTNTDSRFFDFVISASGHMPYEEDRYEYQEFLEIINNSSYTDLDSESKCYLAGQMHLDRGLKLLMEKLEEKGILDDTVIMIFGDHYPYGLSTPESIETVVKETGFNQYRVPFIIYNSEIKGEKIDTLASTFDIYPTIVNLFGLDSTNSYKVGRDVFDSNGERFVPFMDRSVLADTFYYDSSSNSVVSLSEDYDQDNVRYILDKAKDLYEYGQLLLAGDYYSLRK